MKKPRCPYCHKEAKPDLDHKTYWLCHPCWAYVGCHPGTEIPLGRLANAESTLLDFATAFGTRELGVDARSARWRNVTRTVLDLGKLQRTLASVAPATVAFFFATNLAEWFHAWHCVTE